MTEEILKLETIGTRRDQTSSQIAAEFIRWGLHAYQWSTSPTMADVQPGSGTK